MGGRGNSRTQRKHFRQGRENVWKRPKSDDSANGTTGDSTNNATQHWEAFATDNQAFNEYYKEQEVVSPQEWDCFVEYLRKPLPAAFRINSSSQFYGDIRLQLQNDFVKSLQAEDTDGIEIEGIQPLPWYPDNLAWQSNFSRMQLRKNKTLERFHEFLKLENEIGNITRQEAVSMVPPLFLDVQPHHVVLDMCAAPGSKTFQLLEMLYKFAEPGSLPTGMVIANDLDVQRCNLLIHQTKRMCTANLIVTNHEAQHFPSCHLPRNHSGDSQIGNVSEPCIRQLQFDRVLCDVPCSGDGTLRKAPDIWKKWNSGMGNGLHGLQVQIAMRGLALLKVGGRMVYSTCSMNPVENEAVVAEVLRRCKGTVELLDVSIELPKLARRPGLKKWKVRDKGLWLTSFKDVPKDRRSVISQGMFPSGKTCEDTAENDHEPESEQYCANGYRNSEKAIQISDDSIALKSNSEAEVSDLPLERCMRIVPHDQNSGAFFIAVLHKLTPIPIHAVPQKKSRHPHKTDSTSNEPQKQMNDAAEGSTFKDVLDMENAQSSESTPEANCIDYKMSEAPMDTEGNNMHEENEKEESEASFNTKTELKNVAGKRKLQIQGRWRGVDPVIFYEDETVENRVIEFYGIKESFPFRRHLITRNSETNHVKRIYYISKSVKEVLELNFLANQQLKIASVGLKMFERQTSKDGTSAPCIFRISSEGLPLILPHMSKQILYATSIDFKHLLQYKSIKFQDFVDPELREKASELMPGCCVVLLGKDDRVSSNSFQNNTAPIAIGCWRGRTNVSVMVTTTDCQELLQRVSVIVSTDEPSQPESVLSISEVSEEGDLNGSDVKQAGATKFSI